jgi:hypothetical protein
VDFANLHLGNDGSMDTWSSLTGALWDQFWGSGAGAAGNEALKPLRPTLNYVKVAEQFEQLYGKMPRLLPGKRGSTTYAIRVRRKCL